MTQEKKKSWSNKKEGHLIMSCILTLYDNSIYVILKHPHFGHVMNMFQTNFGITFSIQFLFIEFQIFLFIISRDEFLTKFSPSLPFNLCSICNAMRQMKNIHPSNSNHLVISRIMTWKLDEVRSSISIAFLK